MTTRLSDEELARLAEIANTHTGGIKLGQANARALFEELAERRQADAQRDEVTGTAHESIRERKRSQKVHERLHVVGQRRDSSYETFELSVTNDEDTPHAHKQGSQLYEDVIAAVQACETRGIAYINCTRPCRRAS